MVTKKTIDWWAGVCTLASMFFFWFLVLGGCSVPHCVTCPDIPLTEAPPECVAALENCTLLTTDGLAICKGGTWIPVTEF